VLEQRYAAFDGLNLCFETREGILKHCSVKQAEQLGDVGERFVGSSGRRWRRKWPTWPMRSPTTTTTWMTACARGCFARSAVLGCHLRHQLEAVREAFRARGAALVHERYGAW
jgi:hypothetical protein